MGIPSSLCPQCSVCPCMSCPFNPPPSFTAPPPPPLPPARLASTLCGSVDLAMPIDPTCTHTHPPPTLLIPIPTLPLALQAKVWNAKSMTCVRSLACGYGTCCAFGPGNRHAIVGTKTGALQVFDVATGDMIEEIAEAHEVRGCD